MNQYDYIVVGSGIGGLYTALLAKEAGSVRHEQRASYTPLV